MTSHDDTTSVVRCYYTSVDAGKLTDVYNLHHEDLIYQRPGYGLIEGRGELVHFFETERALAWVRHDILHYLTDGDMVAVEGRVEAETTDGHRIENDFADFFRIRNGLIAERRGYFARA